MGVDLKNIQSRYENELVGNVLPFWMNRSVDDQYGGYFSCLGRDGSVYDTDKFVWMLGREVWLFSMLYNRFRKDTSYLDCARIGAEFLAKYGHDSGGDYYFALSREGRPLVQPYNIFSNSFACMAFAQYAKATGSDEYAALSRQAFDRILARRKNPKGKWSKAYPGTRPMKDFALPMIICNLALEVESIISDKSLLDKTIEECLHEVMDVFYRPEIGVMVENLSSVDNSLVDSFEGREINPGHDLEALWFIEDLGIRKGDKALIDKAVDISLGVIEYGWDKEYGGIFYFLDREGKPQQKLEWDQKLWWVHIEAAIAMVKGYQLTGRKECLDWFLRLDDYIWNHFKDKEFPEWFGYLSREGKVLLPLKGGKWKGCFHVPRGLYQISRILSLVNDKLEEK